MWKTLQATVKSVTQAIASPFSNMININIGRAAGIGGLVLSLPTFMRAKITSHLQIHVASLSPAVSFLILIINNYIKSSYLENETSALKNDKKTFDTATTQLKHLYIDRTLYEKHSGSYNNILEILNDTEMDMTTSSIDIKKLQEAMDHCLQDRSQKEKALKYATNFVDLSISTLTGMSAIFINFIIPIVLKNESNDTINHSALVVACLFAFYSSCVALANSENQWLSLKQQKEEALQSINHYYSLYTHLAKKNQDITFNKVSNLVMEWELKNNKIPVV